LVFSIPSVLKGSTPPHSSHLLCPSFWPTSVFFFSPPREVFFPGLGSDPPSPPLEIAIGFPSRVAKWATFFLRSSPPPPPPPGIPPVLIHTPLNAGIYPFITRRSVDLMVQCSLMQFSAVRLYPASHPDFWPPPAGALLRGAGMTKPPFFPTVLPQPFFTDFFFCHFFVALAWFAPLCRLFLFPGMQRPPQPNHAWWIGLTFFSPFFQ